MLSQNRLFLLRNAFQLILKHGYPYFNFLDFGNDLLLVLKGWKRDFKSRILLCIDIGLCCSTSYS